MKVELELTEDVAAYIEYIPKDKLQGILSSLLAEAIKGKSSLRASTEDMQASNSAIAEVMSLLRKVADGGVEKASKASPIKQPQKNKQAKVITLDGFDSDMDADALAMLK